MCEVLQKVFLIAFFTNLCCSLQWCFVVVSPRPFNVADEEIGQDKTAKNIQKYFSAWVYAIVWFFMVNTAGAKPCNDCNNIEGGAAQK